MAKKNKAGNNKGKTSGARKNRQKKRGNGGIAMPSQLVKHVCSITDPFCVHAQGSKWPDGSALNSVPFQVKGQITFTLNLGTALCSLVIAPGLNYGFAQSTGIVAAVATYPVLTAYTGVSDLATQVTQYRLVSGGITITPVVSKMTSGGFIFCQEFAPGGNANLTTLNVDTKQCMSYYRQPLADDTPITYVFKSGGVDSRKFRAINSNNSQSSVDTNDYTFIQLYAVSDSAEGSTVAVVDYVFNYELVMLPSAFLNQIATPAAPKNDAIATISNAAIVNSSSFWSGTQDIVSKQMESAVYSALSSAKPAIKGVIGSTATAYGGPLAGTLVNTIMAGM